MKIVAVVGSLRKESYNRKIAELIKDRYGSEATIQLAFLNNFPMYNPDTEANVPQNVAAVREAIREADGVIFVTPEYNFSIPGSLKNAIEWFSRGGMKILTGKPVMIVGASTGIHGTLRAQLHLQNILDAPGLRANTSFNTMMQIGTVQHRVDENGYLSDDDTLAYLDNTMNTFFQKIKGNA